MGTGLRLPADTMLGAPINALDRRPRARVFEGGLTLGAPMHRHASDLRRRKSTFGSDQRLGWSGR